MFKGLNLDLDFNGKSFNFVEDELFVIYVPPSDEFELPEVFTGRLIGCILQDDYNAFILDSERGIIKIDSLDVQKLFLNHLVMEMTISGYKEM